MKNNSIAKLKKQLKDTAKEIRKSKGLSPDKSLALAKELFQLSKSNSSYTDTNRQIKYNLSSLFSSDTEDTDLQEYPTVSCISIPASKEYLAHFLNYGNYIQDLLEEILLLNPEADITPEVMNSIFHLALAKWKLMYPYIIQENGDEK